VQDNADLRTLHDSVVADRGEPWCIIGGLILRGSCVFVPAASTASRLPSNWRTLWAMRACRKPCDAFTRTSSSSMIAG
jgi:hypothetical protein